MDANTSLQVVVKLATDLLTEVRARITDARTLASKIATTGNQVSAAAEQSKADREAITALLAGMAVPHRWVGTRLDLMGPDGTFIEGQDLKGAKGLNPRGAYSSNGTYQPDDLVWVGFRIWRALQAVTGVTPAEGAKWTIFLDVQAALDAVQQAEAFASTASAAVLSVQTMATAVVADKTAVAADRLAVATDRAGTQADKVASAASATSAAGSAVSASNTNTTVQAALSSVSALALQVAGNKTASDIAAQSAAAVSGLANLSAAARAILLDANNVAVLYDTTKDDDLEWTTKVSNSLTAAAVGTAMRGSKAQHPRLMIIAAQGVARQIVIYDADDPTCPMWWTLNEAAGNLVLTNTVPLVTAISARNGIVKFSESGAGILAIDFVLDKAVLFRQAVTPNCGVYLGALADGNSGKGYPGTLPGWFDNPSLAILNGTVNSVALTILPHTRQNPDRLGMRNPTSVYATAGGIGVIRPDGVAVNSSRTDNFSKVTIDKYGTLYACAGANSTLFTWDYPSYLSSAFPLVTFLTHLTNPASIWPPPVGAMTVKAAGERVAFASFGGGLSLISRNRGILTNSVVAYIDDWRNTGHLMGASKLACAESAKVLSPLQSAEIVTNGKFDTNIAGWLDYSSGAGYTPPTWDPTNGGQLLLNRVDGNNCARVRQELSTPMIGQTYGFSVTARTAGCTFRLGTSIAGNQIVEQAVAAGSTINIYFRAASAITHLLFFPSSNGATTAIDDVSTRVVIADFSPAGNHGEIVGIINRSAVATGADLACWQDLRTSGGNVSIANASGGLNIGTGDFCASVWYKRTNSAAAEALMHFTDEVGGPSDDTGINPNWRLYMISNGLPFLGGRTSSGVFGYSGSTALPTNTWLHLVALRRGGRIEVYVNGLLAVTGTQSGNLSNSSAKLLLGAQFVNGVTNSNRLLGSMALPRLSIGTAPSPAQVASMYADEIQMFQPNAKCLLQGGAGVQDIAHDPDIDLLYVAKSAGGTDVFQGLVNKGTILSTLSVNKFPNSSLSGAVIGGGFGGTIPPPATVNGITMAVVGAGAGYMDIRISGTATGTGAHSWILQNFGLGTPCNAGETWTFSLEEQLIAGSMNGIQHSVRLDRYTAASALVSTTGATAITPTGTVARSAVTVTTETTSQQLIPKFVAGWNNGAVLDATIRVRRLQTEKAAAFSSFVDGMTNSDNHKSVSAHDGNVVIVSATGADAIMPSLALRERLRSRRPVAANDPNVSRFHGRVTADATPTFIGDPIYVPEGGKVDAIVSVAAAVPGGAATELFTTLLKVRANRDIGAAAATVFCSVISGSPSLPDKTTGTMDFTVASMGGGWIGGRATGKAGTPIEWLGEQRLVRSAA